jgi:hypothetical protein
MEMKLTNAEMILLSIKKIYTKSIAKTPLLLLLLLFAFQEERGDPWSTVKSKPQFTTQEDD